MSKTELIQGLNEDLAAEWGTIIRYTHQVAHASGIQGEHLRDILAEEVQDELGHAAFLTDVIVDLGGEPTAVPKDFAKPAGLKEMLEPIWSEARLFTVGELRRLVREAAGGGAVRTTVRTTLWPLWPGSLPLPWGGFITLATRRTGEDREEENP